MKSKDSPLNKDFKNGKTLDPIPNNITLIRLKEYYQNK